MAGRKGKQEVQENLYNAKALIFMKYDKVSYKPGDKFSARESTIEELKENGYAEVDEKPSFIVEKDQDDDSGSGDGQTGQESGGNGGQ